MKITPKNITELKPNEIFVFGTNINGYPVEDTTKIQLEKFGSIKSENIGLSDQLYGFPILSEESNKIELSKLQEYADELLNFIKKNIHLHFFITEIGINAGFSCNEIAPLFKDYFSLKNVSMPLSFLEVIGIEGYKVFKKGMAYYDEVSCENIIIEEETFFFTNPIDASRYYHPSNLYTRVVAVGESKKDDDKIITNKLKIKAKIKFTELIKAHFKIIKDTVKKSEYNVEVTSTDKKDANTYSKCLSASTSGFESNAITSGDFSHASTSGDFSKAITSGNFSHVSTFGGYSCASTSGNESNASTSGNESHANASGDYSNASTSGDYSHASTSGNYSKANTLGNFSCASTSGFDSNASTSGNKSNASTSGDYSNSNTLGIESNASTSGNYSKANTLGRYSNASTSGDYSHASTSGNYSKANTLGSNAISCSLGIESKAKAEKGWIVLVDWQKDNDGNGYIKNIHKAKVNEDKINGVLIKSGTWYWFENGELKSEELTK